MSDLVKLDSQRAKEFLVWLCMHAGDQCFKVKVEKVLMGLHRTGMYESMKEMLPEFWKIHSLHPDSYVMMDISIREVDGSNVFVFQIVYDSEELA